MGREKVNAERRSKKSRFILVALLGVFFIFLSASGVFAWKHLLPKLQEEKTSEKDYAPHLNIGPIYPLDAILVNLADRDVQKFIRVVVQLEMDKDSLKIELDERVPQIQDAIIGLLSMKTLNDVTTLRGKKILRLEIKEKINNFLSTGSIQGVYFTDFITQ